MAVPIVLIPFLAYSLTISIYLDELHPRLTICLWPKFWLTWTHGSLVACVHVPPHSSGPPKCGWMAVCA